MAGRFPKQALATTGTDKLLLPALNIQRDSCSHLDGLALAKNLRAPAKVPWT